MIETALHALSILANAAVCCAVLLLVYNVRVFKRSAERLTRALRDLMVTVSNSEVRDLPRKLAQSADNIQNLAAVVESYNKGAIAAAEAQVSATTSLEKAVTDFKGLMFSRSGDRGTQDYDEGAANREYEISEVMARGIPREEAEARVKERELYSGLNGLRGRV